MTARWLSLALVFALAACAGDGGKKKEAKEAEPKSPMERVERLCQAACARGLRCDEAPVDTCLASCRLEKAPRMHVFRAKFVFAYADCLDKLGCTKELDRCREVAMATVMEDPDERAKREAKKDETKDEDDETTEEKPKKKLKKKLKKQKPDPVAEKKRKREAAAAEDARELYRRCHDRRIGCDATKTDSAWDDRCDMAVALNDGGRERVRECLREPCGQLRRCLQDAVSW